MFRICLILAIVAGLAAGVISFVKVQDVMKQTMTERDNEYKEKVKTQNELGNTKKELTKTKTDLTTTKSELASTKNDLKAANTKADNLEKQKTELAANLERTKAARDTAEQLLARWDGIQMKPEEVKGVIADLAKTKSERAVLITENKILNQKLVEVNNELLNYKDPDRVVQLPLGLKGKILAVDPKYDFVVLDVGKNKQVLERGEMLVNRQGKLIAKLRISSVKDDRSIANVVSGWKQDEIQEGDSVIASQVQ